MESYSKFLNCFIRKPNHALLTVMQIPNQDTVSERDTQ